MIYIHAVIFSFSPLFIIDGVLDGNNQWAVNGGSKGHASHLQPPTARQSA